jgi:hypothetical protein
VGLFVIIPSARRTKTFLARRDTLFIYAYRQRLGECYGCVLLNFVLIATNWYCGARISLLVADKETHPIDVFFMVLWPCASIEKYILRHISHFSQSRIFWPAEVAKEAEKCNLLTPTRWADRPHTGDLLIFGNPLNVGVKRGCIFRPLWPPLQAIKS